MTGAILLIEDQQSVRENIAELLELAGHRVLQAENGIEGIRLAKAHLPDLVLCDIMMPELDGYGVAEVLGRQPETSGIPLIFLTAKADAADFRRGLAKGAVDYISKPFQSHELLETIEMRLKREHPTRRAEAGRAAWDNWVLGLQSDHPATLQGTPLHVLKMDKGSNLYAEGDSSRFIWFIKSGFIKQERMDSKGKKLCLRTLGPGSFSGWTGEFEHGIHTEDAACITPTEVIRIAQSDVHEAFIERPELALELHRRAHEMAKEFESAALSLAYGSARENTARALLRFAVPSSDGLVIRLSREDLANSVGMASESIIRTLASFKQDGLTDTIGRTVVLLNPDGLEDEIG